MGVRVPDGFVELAFRTSVLGDNEEMLCTIGLAADQLEAVSQAGLEAAANVWQSRIIPLQSTECTFRGLFAALGPDGQGPRFQVDRATVGVKALPPVPPNTAILVQKRTALGGRRNRGRMYIPGIPEGEISGAGTITAAQLAVYNTAAEGLRTELAALSFVSECVIFHTTLDTAPAIAPTVITSMNVSAKCATQRRRLR